MSGTATKGLSSLPLFPVVLNLNSEEFEYNFDSYEWEETEGLAAEIMEGYQELNAIEDQSKMLLRDNQIKDHHASKLADKVHDLDDYKDEIKQLDKKVHDEFIKQTVDYKMLKGLDDEVKTIENKIKEAKALM